MTLFTKSKFYYGHTVDINNRNIDFQEGSTLFVATLRPRGYTLQGFATEINRAMNLVSENNYFVSVNRATRQIIIQGDEPFSLLPEGANIGTSALPLAGFVSNTPADTTQTGGASGKEFIPMFPLQDYTDFSIDKEAVDAVVNESASGRVESVFFGRSNFMTCNIRYQTNKKLRSTFNPDGVAELIDFMDYITTKAEIEFMPNAGDPETFTPCLLESTSRSSIGVGYRLTESDGIPGYLDSGRLVFRERVL